MHMDHAESLKKRNYRRSERKGLRDALHLNIGVCEEGIILTKNFEKKTKNSSLAVFMGAKLADSPYKTMQIRFNNLHFFQELFIFNYFIYLILIQG